MNASFQALFTLINSADRLTVLTGAGCSTASGIPDYRDRLGEWKRSQPIQYQAFVTSRAARRRYWSRSMLGWPHFERARPTAAHFALSKLQKQRKVEALITQNVDGLHQKAGASGVLELHGGLDNVKCMSCGEFSSRADLQRLLENDNRQWLDLVGTLAPDGDIDVDVPEDLDFAVPECAACGGQLKPDVVFFGESVPRERVERASIAVRKSDALLVVGSSLMVFSGWRFVRQAHQQGIPIGIINQGVTRGDPQARVKLESECGSALTAVVTRLFLEPS
jgi:NAD-dependent SIR2 family protein deacetylase